MIQQNSLDTDVLVRQRRLIGIRRKRLLTDKNRRRHRRWPDTLFLPIIYLLVFFVSIVYVHSMLLPDDDSSIESGITLQIKPPPFSPTFEACQTLHLRSRHHGRKHHYKENVCLFLSDRFVTRNEAQSACNTKQLESLANSKLVEIEPQSAAHRLISDLINDLPTDNKQINKEAWILYENDVNVAQISDVPSITLNFTGHSHSFAADLKLPALCLSRNLKQAKHHHHYSATNNSDKNQHSSTQQHTAGLANNATQHDKTNQTSAQVLAKPLYAPIPLSLTRPKRAVHFRVTKEKAAAPSRTSLAKAKAKAAAAALAADFDDVEDGEEEETDEDIPDAAAPAGEKPSAAIEFDDWDGVDTHEMAAPSFDASDASMNVEYKDNFDEEEGGEEVEEETEEAAPAVQQKTKKSAPAAIAKKQLPQQPYKVKYFKSFDVDDDDENEEEEDIPEAAAPAAEKPVPVVAAKPVVVVVNAKPKQPNAVPPKSPKAAAAAAVAKPVVKPAAPPAAKVAAKPAQPAKAAAPPAPVAKPAAVAAKPAAVVAKLPVPPAKPSFDAGDDESTNDKENAPNDPGEWDRSAAKPAAAPAAVKVEAKPVVAAEAPAVAAIVAAADKPHLDDVLPPAKKQEPPAAALAGVVVPPQPAVIEEAEITAYDRKRYSAAEKKVRKDAKRAAKAQRKAHRKLRKSKKKGHKGTIVVVEKSDLNEPAIQLTGAAVQKFAPQFDEPVAAVYAPSNGPANAAMSQASVSGAAQPAAPWEQAAPAEAAQDAAAVASSASQSAAAASNVASAAAGQAEEAADNAEAHAGAKAAGADHEAKELVKRKRKAEKKRKKAAKAAKRKAQGGRRILGIGSPFKSKKRTGEDGKKYTVFQVPIAKLANMEENSMERLFGHAKTTLRNALEQLPEPLQNAETHDDFTARAILTHIVARYYLNYNDRDIHEIAKRLFRTIMSKGKPRQCFKADQANTFEPVACLSPDGPVETCIKAESANGTLVRGCGIPNKGVGALRGSCQKDKHGHLKCMCDRDLCKSAPAGRGRRSGEHVARLAMALLVVGAATYTSAVRRMMTMTMWNPYRLW